MPPMTVRFRTISINEGREYDDSINGRERFARGFSHLQ